MGEQADYLWDSMFDRVFMGYGYDDDEDFDPSWDYDAKFMRGPEAAARTEDKLERLRGQFADRLTLKGK